MKLKTVALNGRNAIGNVIAWLLFLLPYFLISLLIYGVWYSYAISRGWEIGERLFGK